MYRRGHAFSSTARSLEALLEPLLLVVSACLLVTALGGEEEVGCCCLKSKAVPAVFGVLLADPNAANAPDPSPKADDAPPAELTLVFRGGTPFEEFCRAGEGCSPDVKRLED